MFINNPGGAALNGPAVWVALNRHDRSMRIVREAVSCARYDPTCSSGIQFAVCWYSACFAYAARQVSVVPALLEVVTCAVTPSAILPM